MIGEVEHTLYAMDHFFDKMELLMYLINNNKSVELIITS